MDRMMVVLPLLALLAGCNFGGEDDESAAANPVPARTLVGTEALSQRYFQLYNEVKLTHDDLQRTLGDTKPNPLRASSQLTQMRTNAKQMAMMVSEPTTTQLLELAEKFDQIKEKIRQSTHTSYTIAQLAQLVHAFSRNFAPGSVVLRDEVLPDVRPTPEPAAVNLPPSLTPAPEPRLPPVETPVVRSTPDPLKQAPWMYYKAWVQEHQELTAAVQAGEKDKINVHYPRVLQLVGALYDGLTDDQRKHLAIYRGEYELINTKTNGFKQFSDTGYTQAYTLKALEVLADAMKLHVNPDR